MTDSKTGDRKMRFYPRSGVVDMVETDLFAAPEMSAETMVAMGDLIEAGLDHGSKSEVLVRQTPEQGGFCLLLVTQQPNFPITRHSHEGDCLYFIVSGSVHLGNRVLETGECFFVPSEAPYQYSAGPEGAEVLEIRHGIVSSIESKVYENSPERWKAMADVMRASRSGWGGGDTPVKASFRR